MTILCVYIHSSHSLHNYALTHHHTHHTYTTHPPTHTTTMHAYTHTTDSFCVLELNEYHVVTTWFTLRANSALVADEWMKQINAAQVCRREGREGEGREEGGRRERGGREEGGKRERA